MSALSELTQEHQHYQQLLQQYVSAEGGSESRKLQALIKTVENVEEEYRNREKQRIDDLQLVVDNVFASKGVLKYTRDYHRQFDGIIEEVGKSITDIDKKIEDLSLDSLVLEKRFTNFKNNVVGQAEECQWEMDHLMALLENTNYSGDEVDDEEDEKIQRLKSTSVSMGIGHADLGTLGLQLNKIKKSIDLRNEALEEMAKKFQQIRYAHAMQYHHNRDEYVWYRKNIDLQGTEETSSTLGRRLSIGSTASDDQNIGMLLDLEFEEESEVVDVS